MKSKSDVRIIICDDDPVTRVVLTKTLEELGYKVTQQASDAFQAITLCETLQPDILFLDINMPGLDGLTAIELIRNTAPSTNIILVSGASTLDNVRKAIKLGVRAFVVKPFNALKLTDAMVKCVF
jgi:YesN/AraC family two-component response regulator